MVHSCKECGIPAVKVDELLLNYYLKSSLIGLNKCSSSSDLLRKFFIRLTAKSIYEYGKGRDYMIKEIEEANKDDSKKSEGYFIYAHIISDHLENCINSINRACKIFDLLKESEMFAIDRQKMIEFKRYSDSTCAVRDTFKDMEDEWKKEELNEEHSATLCVVEGYEYIEITKHKVSLADFVQALEHAHELGLAMASSECKMDK